MLINVKAVKIKIKTAGLRSKMETIMAIDRKFDGMLEAILALAKAKSLVTLKQEDIL